MAKLSKNRKAALAKFDQEATYDLIKAAEIVKEITTTKFDASFDVDIRLGVDPRKANQMVRGIATLPHGTGKEVKVLVLCTPDKVQEALDAGADFAGLDEYVEKIKGGWTDVDVIITMPACMGKVGALGRVLGPRGLMPNPKAGKIDFKVDKYGIIHASAGKVSFSADQLAENANELMNVIMKLKPSSAKGAYVKSLTFSSTQSVGVKVEVKSFL